MNGRPIEEVNSFCNLVQREKSWLKIPNSTLKNVYCKTKRFLKNLVRLKKVTNTRGSKKEVTNTRGCLLYTSRCV